MRKTRIQDAATTILGLGERQKTMVENKKKVRDVAGMSPPIPSYYPTKITEPSTPQGSALPKTESSWPTWPSNPISID